MNNELELWNRIKLQSLNNCWINDWIEPNSTESSLYSVEVS